MLACSLASSGLVSDNTRPASASVLTTAGRLNVTSSVVVTSPRLVLASSRTVHCIMPVPDGQASARPIKPPSESHLPQVFDIYYADLELNWLGMCVYGLLLEQRQVCPGRFPSPRDRRPADHGHAAQGDPGPVTAA